MIKLAVNTRKRRKRKERRYKHRKVGIVGAKEVGVRQNSEKVDWKGRSKNIYINQMKYAIPVYERWGVQRSIITNLTSLCFLGEGNLTSLCFLGEGIEHRSGKQRQRKETQR